MEEVLILGDPADPHSKAVCAELQRRNCRYLIGDAWSPATLHSIRLSSDYRIQPRWRFKSAWLRLKPRYHTLGQADAFAARERREFLMGTLYSCVEKSRCINDPRNQEISRNKIYQLNVARQLRLAIPNTIVTNMASEITEQLGSADFIYKPLSWLATTEGEVLFTNTVSVDPPIADSRVALF